MIARKIIRSPIVVALMDSSGLPIFTYPDQDKYKLLGSATSAIVNFAKTMTESKQPTFIKTDDGVVLLGFIPELGTAIFYYDRVSDADEVRWIMNLFIRSIRDEFKYIEEGFITDSDIKRFKSLYENFQKALRDADEALNELNNIYSTASTLIGQLATKTINSCSEGILKIRDNLVEIDTDQLLKNNLDLQQLKNVLDTCIRQLKNVLRRAV